LRSFVVGILKTVKKSETSFIQSLRNKLNGVSVTETLEGIFAMKHTMGKI